jgi:hypothetical protein
MIKPYTISTQMWIEKEEDTLGMSGSFVEFRINVESIDGYWIENELEIVLIIKGTAYYIESTDNILIFLNNYFGDKIT